MSAKTPLARYVLIAAVAVSGGALAWMTLKPAEPAAPAEVEAAAQAASAAVTATPTMPEASPSAAPVQTTAVDAFPSVRLALVEVSAGASPPHAMIEVEGRLAKFEIGAEVFAGIRLEQVALDRVVLTYGTATRTLRLPAPLSGARGAAPTVAGAGEDPNEIRVRNKGIDVKRLTQARPQHAESFLREVLVSANPRGGFVVEQVTPGGVYDKLGLRPGDVIYSLDTPKMAAVNEGSMVALMQQTEIEMEVYRNGTQITLRHALNVDPQESTVASR